MAISVDVLKKALPVLNTYFGTDFLPYYVRTVFGKKQDSDIIGRASFLAKRFKSFFTRLQNYDEAHKTNLLNMNDLEKQVLTILQDIIDIDLDLIDSNTMFEHAKDYCKKHMIVNADEITEYITIHAEPINAAVMRLLESTFDERERVMNILGVHSKFIKFITRDYTKVKTVDEYISKFKSLLGQSLLNLNSANNDGIVKITHDDFDLEVARAKNRWRIGTGMAQFDYILSGGFEGGRVYLFAGGSGGGKSLVLINLAMRALLELGLWPNHDVKKGVLYITLENSVEETRSRFICATSRATRYQILSTDHNVSKGSEVKSRFYFYMDAIHDMYFYVVWRAPKSISAIDIVRFVRQIEANDGVEIKMVIIDYLDKLSSTSENINEPDWVKLGNVVDELKATAVALDIPILSVSQVNRGGYNRNGGTIYGETIAGSIRKKENADFLMTMNFAAKRELDMEFNKPKKQLVSQKKDDKNEKDEQSFEELLNNEIESLNRKVKPVEVTCWVDKNRDGPANVEMKLYIDYAAYALSYSPDLLSDHSYKTSYIHMLKTYQITRQRAKRGEIKIDPTGRRRKFKPTF